MPSLIDLADDRATPWWCRGRGRRRSPEAGSHAVVDSSMALLQAAARLARRCHARFGAGQVSASENRWLSAVHEPAHHSSSRRPARGARRCRETRCPGCWPFGPELAEHLARPSTSLRAYGGWPRCERDALLADREHDVAGRRRGGPPRPGRCGRAAAPRTCRELRAAVRIALERAEPDPCASSLADDAGDDREVGRDPPASLP